MECPTGMTVEPLAHLGMLMRGVIVEDGVDDFAVGTSASIALRKQMNS